MELVPAILQSFTLSPSRAHTSLRRTVGAGPECVPLRGSWLHYIKKNLTISNWVLSSTDSHKAGYEAYAEWKLKWNRASQREASVRAYVADILMPYWLKCNLCGKWRKQPKNHGDPTPELISSWTCRNLPKSPKKEHVQYCSVYLFFPFHCHVSLFKYLNIKFIVKIWNMFSNNINTTIRKFSSRAFIWVVTPLDFAVQFRI